MSTSKAVLPEERFVILLRHGIAEEPSATKRDEDRGLTRTGQERMKEIARGLERALPNVQTIYSSPLLRAMQTALWVSKGYRSKARITTDDALSPGTTNKQFAAFLNGIHERRVILVGHEPNLTDSLRALIGIEGSDGVELKKGGCYGVRLFADGKATLEWVLPPRILRKLGS